jgi:hypothetical protein
LAILLVVAIAISLGGTFFSLNRLSNLMRAPPSTGYATNPQGSAIVNITAIGSLKFALGLLDFGIGSVNTTDNEYCSMASGADSGFKDANNRCIDFNDPATFKSLVIENDGTKNLTITMDSNKNAATFIGGTGSPGFKFYVTNNETGSCPDPVPAAWTNVNLTTMNLCSGTGLGFDNGADTMYIHLNITIPYNSLLGLQEVTLTVTGTPAGI